MIKKAVSPLKKKEINLSERRQKALEKEGNWDEIGKVVEIDENIPFTK